VTVGQRIAYKRKELGLSQEGLGELLGVSRQAIYKWESDTTLPEIDKLIALSRTFRVSVGWLLGEEETPSEGELNDQQLRMVQEIVDRYLSAQPAKADSQPEPEASAPLSKKHKNRLFGAVVAAFALVLLFINLFGRLDNLDHRYQNLQNSIGSIHVSVNNQVNSIANRVEQILESQNQLTAERSAAVKSTDLAANTITFTVRTVPKTYRDGMTALFVARSDGDVTEVPVQVGPGNAFEGEITCPLTDDIELSVVFLSDGQRQTQFIDDWTYLYSDSFPSVYFVSGPLWFDVDDKTGTLTPDHAWLNVDENTESDIKGGQVEIADIRVGLFKDRKLLFWYREALAPIIVNGVQQEQTRYFRDETVTLDPTSSYSQAVVVTDQYGRVRVSDSDNLEYHQGDWHHSSPYVGFEAPSFWDFD